MQPSIEPFILIFWSKQVNKIFLCKIFQLYMALFFLKMYYFLVAFFLWKINIPIYLDILHIILLLILLGKFFNFRLFNHIWFLRRCITLWGTFNRWSFTFNRSFILFLRHVTQSGRSFWILSAPFVKLLQIVPILFREGLLYFLNYFR